MFPLPPPPQPSSCCIVGLVCRMMDVPNVTKQEGLLQKAAEMARAIPWEETLTISDIPLELEDVHDDLKR